MKVLNKDVLKKCGFDKIYDIRDIEKYGVYYNRKFLVGINEDGSFNFNMASVKIFEKNVVGIGFTKDFTILIYEMTKAGCFDEKSKTLEKCGFIELECPEYWKKEFYKKDTREKIVMIINNPECEDFYVTSGVKINKELHQAIQNKMEELKNEKDN